MDGFANLLEIAQRPEAPSTALQSALKSAQDEVTAAETAITEAESAYRASLLDTDPGVSKGFSDARGDPSLRRDRAVALVDALTPRLADALEREEQQRRIEVYREAEAKRDAAIAAIRRDLPEIELIVSGLLGAIGEANVSVDRVNKAVPNGAVRLVGPEMTLFGTPARERSEVSREEKILWCIAGREHPLDANRQQQLADLKGDKALVKLDSAIGGTPIVRRRFSEVKFHKGGPARIPRSIAGMSLEEIAREIPQERPLSEGEPSVELIPGDWLVHPFAD
jgi:hypothetical protein